MTLTEIDALVAEKVLGLEIPALNRDSVCPECGCEMWFGDVRARCCTCNEWRYQSTLEYTADMAAAWTVVEKMLDDGWSFEFRQDPMKVGAAQFRNLFTEGHCGGYVESAPLRICLAALDAHGIDAEVTQ